ncbi:MAG: insulinase family protein [Clostridia bacterium]|nr:insulinase family protein [Clostridia bacterium]
MSYTVNSLASGVDGYFIENSRFNTTLISFNFYLPLNRDTVAQNALLPFVLTTCSKDYPEFSDLNFKLSKLYGAELIAVSEKVGDFQLLKIGISVISDKYTLDNEELTSQAIELLLGLIFKPAVESGEFKANDVEREKRKAIEHILGELAEKRTYAKGRLIEEMYKNDPYGTSKCGTVEAVEKIDGKALYDTWENMLKTAYVRVNVISSELPAGLFDKVSNTFLKIDRKDVTDFTRTVPTKVSLKVNRIDEEMNVSQGKLVMGFSSKLSGSDKDCAALTVMADILGGGPYSKLFLNVREKQRLCYYCAVRAVKVMGLLTVDSGVCKENMEKTEQAISEQLKAMQNGEISDLEFNSSMKAILDSFKTYNDSQNLLDTWYSIKIADKKPITPEELSDIISKVKKEDITDAARGIKLHTVYRLIPEQKEAL